MEEASLDHGIDRLPFFIFSLLLLFMPEAFATSFGPINVVNQAQNAQYVVRGKIQGSSWVMEERQTRRPYTHWKLQILEQSKGENIGPEVMIRQPGGELGEYGYHVAGSAQFKEGEEVFVNLQDTDEPNIKEVVGLASGKYTVERSGGKSQLRSGIGFIVQNNQGQPFSAEAFSAVVRRVEKQQETEEDKSIFVTKKLTHEENPELESRIKEAQAHNTPTSESEQTHSPIQESPPSTEEPKGSSGWPFYSLALLAALAVGVFFYRKR